MSGVWLVGRWALRRECVGGESPSRCPGAGGSHQAEPLGVIVPRGGLLGGEWKLESGARSYSTWQNLGGNSFLRRTKRSLPRGQGGLP